jgi:hypothetical protein
MQPGLNRLFAAAVFAYRIGVAKAIEMSAGATGVLFERRGQEFIRERLGVAELESYQAVRDRCREAVRLTRGSSLEASRQAFDDAERLSRQLRTDEGRLLGQSWIHQGRAFLEARNRRWDEAREVLRLAMECDARLEVEHGYQLFHVARAHVVHLLLRVEAQAANLALAIDLAQAVVDYVDGRRDSLPVGEGWSREKAAAVPADLRYGLLARLASEVGAILATSPLPQARDLFERFPGWMAFAGHPTLEEIHRWGVAKRAFLAGDTVAFLQACSEMLNAGRGETALWQATAVDLCRCCEALRPEQTRVFRADVAKDAESWPRLPVGGAGSLLRSALRGDSSPPSSSRGAAYRHATPDRRFQIHSVGLPRTGTSSISSIFGRFRSGNEYMEAETIRRIVARHDGTRSEADLRDFVSRRDWEGGLEVDAASFNHFYLDVLVEMFPRCQFLFTIREPYPWTNSYMKMLRRWHRRRAAEGRRLPDWMHDYGRLIIGQTCWSTLFSDEIPPVVLKDVVDRFVQHWGEANRRILSLLPRDRSLVIPTRSLSSRLDEIAAFAGVAPSALTERHHVNASPDDRDLLAGLDRAWFDERCAAHAADVLGSAAMASRDGSAGGLGVLT